MSYPSYWPKSGWSYEVDLDKYVGGYGEAGNAMDSWDALMEGAGAGNYSEAELTEGDMYRAIELFVARNLASKKVSMSVKSGTYQKIARDLKANLLKDTDGAKMGRQQRDQNIRRLDAMLGKQGKAAKNVADSATIRKIMVIRNQELWTNYVAAKQEMKDAVRDQEDPLPFRKVKWIDAPPTTIGSTNNTLPVIDSSIGEMYLFHGSASIDKITRGGFATDRTRLPAPYNAPKESHGRTDWGMLGMGSYFADAMGKSMVYFLCEKHAAYNCSCTRYILLCRVILGRALVRRGKTNPFGRMKNWLRSDTHEEIRGEKMASGLAAAKYHSVIGAAGRKMGGFTENEFLVKRSNMIYPEFVIHYGVQ